MSLSLLFALAKKSGIYISNKNIICYNENDRHLSISELKERENMQKIVEDFIKLKKTEKSKKCGEYLMDLGFYNKIYQKEENDSSKDYNCYDTGSKQSYRKEMINLTPEEEEEVSKYISKGECYTPGIAILLKIIAYLTIIAVFIIGAVKGEKTDSFSIALIYITSGLIISIPIFAMARMLIILNKIEFNTRK